MDMNDLKPICCGRFANKDVYRNKDGKIEHVGYSCSRCGLCIVSNPASNGGLYSNAIASWLRKFGPDSVRKPIPKKKIKVAKRA